MNDDPIAQGGSVVSAAQHWVDLVNNLRNGTVNYVELSIGGDSSSFANIRTLIQKYGIGTENPLYNNLAALQPVLNLNAVDYDDENEYDANSSLQLAKMCVSLGMQVSICPYMMQSYWVDLVNQINGAMPGTVVASYLQCYSGGAGNDPNQWNSAFKGTGLRMTAGLEVNSSSPSAVQSQLANWESNPPLAGGFMFAGTQMTSSTPADYSAAISQGLQSRAS